MKFISGYVPGKLGLFDFLSNQTYATNEMKFQA